MNKNYFDLAPDDQRALLRVAEDRLGLSDIEAIAKLKPSEKSMILAALDRIGKPSLPIRTAAARTYSDE